MKVIRKSTFREIKSSLGRFLAIFAIIALGVGFFAGLKVARGSMLDTVKDYLDEHAFYDFRLLSTLGFDPGDTERLRQQEDVAAVEGAVSLDVLYQLEDGSQGVVKVHSLTDTVNTVELVSGRLPETDNECVADSAMFGEGALGSVISLSDDNEEETLDCFTHRDYTIVGIVQSPLYIQYERGNTSLGTGRLDGFLYLRRDGFDMDYDTEVYVRFDQDNSLYGADYTAFRDEKEEPWEKLADEAAGVRYQRILTEAEEELADAREEFREQKAEGEKELADAERKLADAEKELADGEQALADARQELADGKKTLREKEQELSEGRQTVTEKKAELAEGEAELAKGEQEWKDSQGQVSSGWNSLNAQKGQLQQQKAALEEQWAQVETQAAELQGQVAQLEQQSAVLEAQEEQLEAKAAELEKESARLASWSVQLDVLEAKLAAGEIPPDQVADAKQQVEAGRQQVEAGLQQVAAGRQQVEAGKSQVEAGLQQIAGYRQQAEAGLQQIAAYRQEIESGRQVLASYESQAAEAERQLRSAESRLAEGRKTLDDAAREIAEGRQAIEDAERELADGEKALEDARGELADAEETLTEKEREFQDAKIEFADGEREYEEGLEEFQREIADAERELADAEADIADIKAPDTYVLGRDTNIGYVCFENDSGIVDGIANIFPVFFFLVAALVCITTMNRMVEEQRTQIGVLKALGYSNRAIMSKYIVYSGLAAVLGCISGFFLGTWGFPQVIWYVYGIMYRAGSMAYVFDWGLALISLAASLLCSMGTTWISCRAELGRNAAQLMRPKAPKAGKRVFLERTGFLWRRLSFLQKVSVRNIFRYKKRLFMMVVGISGCTALLVTGFGINDSIADVAAQQFEEVQTYDIGISLQEEWSGELERKLEGLSGLGMEDFLPVMEKNMDIVTDKGVKSIYLVAADGEEMQGFLDMHTRNGEKIAYPESGSCVVTRKLARQYGIRAGDSVVLRDEKMQEFSVTVAAVMENYIYNYVYISEETWSAGMGGEPEKKTVYVNLSEDADAHRLSAELMNLEETASVSVNADMTERIGSMMESLNIIVAVVILCAGGLAFVVLYNLTNINITERIREIATVKVLGFFKKETASYVFRENILLTVMGMFLGLLLGRLLHAFVMNEIQVDMIAFDITIRPVSYLYSALLTVAFAWAVNLFMGGRLEKVSMTESLKSVD